MCIRADGCIVRGWWERALLPLSPALVIMLAVLPTVRLVAVLPLDVVAIVECVLEKGLALFTFPLEKAIEGLLMQVLVSFQLMAPLESILVNVMVLLQGPQ